MIEIWGKSGCGYCEAAKRLCEQRNFSYRYYQLSEHFTREELLEKFPTATTYPQININGIHVGGYAELGRYLEDTGYNGTGWTL